MDGWMDGMEWKGWMDGWNEWNGMEWNEMEWNGWMDGWMDE